ncbi:MAG TPA: Fur family transcriptional regulator [Paracoccaceae bacterium]|nr:Fur family transcriptional regulator [Paracoccaceae bacterium]
MHDCPACSRSADATAALAARGERVTALRSRVLAALHHAEKPLGAYEIFGRLKAEGAASAPPAVYRVLEFLEAQGLVHKLQSLSAYRACTAPAHPHHALFRICRLCGEVSEAESPALGQIATEAEADGFRVEHMVVETLGLCGHCAEAPA